MCHCVLLERISTDRSLSPFRTLLVYIRLKQFLGRNYLYSFWSNFYVTLKVYPRQLNRALTVFARVITIFSTIHPFFRGLYMRFCHLHLVDIWIIYWMTLKGRKHKRETLNPKRSNLGQIKCIVKILIYYSFFSRLWGKKNPPCCICKVLSLLAWHNRSY